MIELAVINATTILEDDLVAAQVAAVQVQIDRDWTPEIEADFTQWMKDNIDKLPVSHAAVQEYIDALAKRAAR